MRTVKSYTDQELLDCLKSGDQQAFAEIYNRYWKVMYFHALKMLGDEDDAKDLAQELFATLWTKGTNLPFNSNLSGYLYITARNKIINLIQQKKVRRDYLSALSAFAEEAGNGTVEQIDEKELLLIVEKEIQNLPVKMRQVFELSRKQFLSHKEIATQLGISDKTVKKQIGYAIRMIKLKLDVLTRITIILFFLK
ncbi:MULTISPECIES: RNA polymerase sigma factor [Pedobacter]|uniref:RNA polymerase sigma-70 factor n=1 Tax=Pedobacter heparinus (strain ATCC 13125 / DSM 2366 / CIP 104194 / JCM 7457 / NBRC 12017 / NCIMB 9290 / NRRL B-14731 / HIM 762-3) TaxID=485917 RepID=C6Y3R1_PEDHD|nr:MULTISPECIES: RNA polymerase sigma-70 factor [Pedobacter]ACU03340.1 RNA polymerase sigma-70 factor [Pedobacter heparinus DSM 2366]MBB5441369.1 RNA polymerase sigma-70 factor (ECF subfamily) [Pedobacter sp. AK017]